MMWRFSFLFLFAATVLQAQTPPPPPPPPPLQLYTPPTKEEMTAWYFKQHEVMDELLNSSEYYKPEDLIFYESSQTSKAELKLKSSRVEAIDEDSNVVGQFNFEVLYNAQGQIAQTTQFGEGSRYEYIRRWKYNTAGKVQSYVTLDRETDAATKKVKVNGDSMVINYLPSGSISDIKRYSVRNSGASRTASLISTRKFIYNADGTLKQRSEDGSNYFYFYDAEKHPVRVCTVADRKASGRRRRAGSSAPSPASSRTRATARRTAGLRGARHQARRAAPRPPPGRARPAWRRARAGPSPRR